MKAFFSSLWHGVIPTLFLCTILPHPHSRFKPLYRYDTDKGPFYIAEFKGRFYLLYKGDESFGSYPTPEDAAADVDLVRFLVLKGMDVGSLNIPKDLQKWERLG
jgi:hypothetical protein